jgi:hypothetical protein
MRMTWKFTYRRILSILNHSVIWSCVDSFTLQPYITLETQFPITHLIGGWVGRKSLQLNNDNICKCDRHDSLGQWK